MQEATAGALDHCFSHVASLAPRIPKPVLYFFPSPGFGVHFDFFAGGTAPHPGSPGVRSGFHHGTSGFGSGIYPGSLVLDSGSGLLLGGTGSFVAPAWGGSCLHPFSPGLGMGFFPGPGSSGFGSSVAFLIGGSGSLVACGFGFFSLPISVPPLWWLRSVAVRAAANAFVKQTAVGFVHGSFHNSNPSRRPSVSGFVRKACRHLSDSWTSCCPRKSRGTPWPHGRPSSLLINMPYS